MKKKIELKNKIVAEKYRTPDVLINKHGSIIYVSEACRSPNTLDEKI